ncbi:hypothetical protein BGZ46_002338 [Entomortierella lignicola]|nr:hypothetical protein BGZ46_002338 [Entomortierella lignicola]
MAGSLENYCEMIKALSIWKGLPEIVRLYAKRLNDFFTTEIGELLLENMYMAAIVLSKQESTGNQLEANPDVQQEIDSESSSASPPPPPFSQTPLHGNELDSDNDVNASALDKDESITISFVETDVTETFQLSDDDKKVYDEAREWFGNKIQRKIDDTIADLRGDRFRIPWIHDLLYDR